MARPPNRPQRRQQILDAFYDVVARHGFVGATTLRVAERAGLAPGLIHYHFESKEALLLALAEDLTTGLFERQRARLEARADAREDAEADAWARLDALIEAFLAPGEDARPAALAAYVALAYDALREPAVRDSWQRGLERVEGELLACLEVLVPERGAATQLVHGIASALHGAAYLGVARPGAFAPGFPAATVKAWARASVAATRS